MADNFDRLIEKSYKKLSTLNFKNEGELQVFLESYQSIIASSKSEEIINNLIQLAGKVGVIFNKNDIYLLNASGELRNNLKNRITEKYDEFLSNIKNLTETTNKPHLIQKLHELIGAQEFTSGRVVHDEVHATLRQEIAQKLNEMKAGEISSVEQLEETINNLIQFHNSEIIKLQDGQSSIFEEQKRILTDFDSAINKILPYENEYNLTQESNEVGSDAESKEEAIENNTLMQVAQNSRVFNELIFEYQNAINNFPNNSTSQEYQDYSEFLNLKRNELEQRIEKLFRSLQTIQDSPKGLKLSENTYTEMLNVLQNNQHNLNVKCNTVEKLSQILQIIEEHPIQSLKNYTYSTNYSRVHREGLKDLTKKTSISQAIFELLGTGKINELTQYLDSGEYEGNITKDSITESLAALKTQSELITNIKNEIHNWEEIPDNVKSKVEFYSLMVDTLTEEAELSDINAAKEYIASCNKKEKSIRENIGGAINRDEKNRVLKILNERKNVVNNFVSSWEIINQTNDKINAFKEEVNHNDLTKRISDLKKQKEELLVQYDKLLNTAVALFSPGRIKPHSENLFPNSHIEEDFFDVASDLQRTFSNLENKIEVAEIVSNVLSSTIEVENFSREKCLEYIETLKEQRNDILSRINQDYDIADSDTLIKQAVDKLDNQIILVERIQQSRDFIDRVKNDVNNLQASDSFDTKLNLLIDKKSEIEKEINSWYQQRYNINQQILKLTLTELSTVLHDISLNINAEIKNNKIKDEHFATPEQYNRYINNLETYIENITPDFQITDVFENVTNAINSTLLDAKAILEQHKETAKSYWTLKTEQETLLHPDNFARHCSEKQNLINYQRALLEKQKSLNRLLQNQYIDDGVKKSLRADIGLIQERYELVSKISKILGSIEKNSFNYENFHQHSYAAREKYIQDFKNNFDEIYKTQSSELFLQFPKEVQNQIFRYIQETEQKIDLMNKVHEILNREIKFKDVSSVEKCNEYIALVNLEKLEFSSFAESKEDTGIEYYQDNDLSKLQNIATYRLERLIVIADESRNSHEEIETANEVLGNFINNFGRKKDEVIHSDLLVQLEIVQKTIDFYEKSDKYFIPDRMDSYSGIIDTSDIDSQMRTTLTNLYQDLEIAIQARAIESLMQDNSIDINEFQGKNSSERIDYIISLQTSLEQINNEELFKQFPQKVQARITAYINETSAKIELMTKVNEILNKEIKFDDVSSVEKCEAYIQSLTDEIQNFNPKEEGAEETKGESNKDDENLKDLAVIRLNSLIDIAEKVRRFLHTSAIAQEGLYNFESFDIYSDYDRHLEWLRDSHKELRSASLISTISAIDANNLEYINTDDIDSEIRTRLQDIHNQLDEQIELTRNVKGILQFTQEKMGIRELTNIDDTDAEIHRLNEQLQEFNNYLTNIDKLPKAIKEQVENYKQEYHLMIEMCSAIRFELSIKDKKQKEHSAYDASKLNNHISNIKRLSENLSLLHTSLEEVQSVLDVLEEQKRNIEPNLKDKRTVINWEETDTFLNNFKISVAPNDIKKYSSIITANNMEDLAQESSLALEIIPDENAAPTRTVDYNKDSDLIIYKCEGRAQPNPDAKKFDIILAEQDTPKGIKIVNLTRKIAGQEKVQITDEDYKMMGMMSAAKAIEKFDRDKRKPFVIRTPNEAEAKWMQIALVYLMCDENGRVLPPFKNHIQKIVNYNKNGRLKVEPNSSLYDENFSNFIKKHLPQGEDEDFVAVRKKLHGTVIAEEVNSSSIFKQRMKTFKSLEDNKEPPTLKSS